MKQTNDLNIRTFTPIIPPEKLKSIFPMTEESNRTVIESREIITKILAKQDPRIIAIIGPCSIHDPSAALEYAEKLRQLAEKVEDVFYVVMRVYFEKPRTTVGWRGLIIDPDLDGSYDIEKGLKIARKLMLDISALGLPVGSEVLDPIIPQYISDLISWASIGARTTESQTHREMTSGLSMPVGFKNGTSGNLQLAFDALKSSKHPHSFIGIDQNGQTCVVHTKGNGAVHIILRGGRSGPNYYEETVESAAKDMELEGLEPSIVIDCSHSNSGKDFRKQERVLRSVIDQKLRGNTALVGFMLESYLVEGRQKLTEKDNLVYGCSVTDECIGWEETEAMVLSGYEKLRRKI
jgi:3-deoxy-7-phosphoheptulonate synthase